MKKKYNILYVDDENSNLMVFEEMYSPLFNVTIAKSGKKGLELLKSNSYHLIISDQRMPLMTGVEFLEKAKKLAPEVSMILLTAYADYEAASISINELKIFQLVQKPWEFEDMLAVINNAIDSYILKKSNNELNAKLKEEIRLKDLLLEELKLSEKNLKDAQKIAQIGHWDLDIVNNELKWSDEVFRIFGLKPQEFEATYEAFENTIHPDDREIVSNAYTNSLKNRKPYEIVHRLVKPDGEIRYVREKCRTFFKKDMPVRTIGTVQDISELYLKEEKIKSLNQSLEDRVRKRTQELENEKQFTNSIIDVIPGVFFAFDENGTFINWNKNFLQLTEYSKDVMSQIHPLDTISPDYREDVEKKIAEIYKTGYSEIETRILSKSKKEYPYFLTGRKLELNNKIYIVGTGFDLSDLKKTQKALKESEERFRELSDMLPQSVFETDLYGNITYTNQQGYAISGYNKKDIKNGLSLFNIVSPNDLNKLRTNIKKRYKGIAPVSNEYTIITKKGKGIPVLVYTGAIIKDGEPQGLRGILLDISERKKTESILFEQAAFVMNNPAPSMKVGLNGKIKFCNPSANKILKLQNSNNNSSIIEIFNGITKKNFDQIKDKEIFTFEEKLDNKYFLFTVKKDLKTETIYLYGSNITKRKAAEEEIKKISQALEQSSATIVITDKEGNIQYVNNSFEAFSGYKSKEVLGKNPRILKSGDFPDSYYKNLWDTILSGKIWRGEFVNKKKSGEDYWVTASIAPIFNSEKEIVQFIAVKEDITEQKRLEKELKIEKQKADSANKAKSEFLANMSHEIRTPMNSISGFTELLINNEDNPLKLDYLESIKASGRSLLNLINDILDLSKVESGKMEIKKNYFDTIQFVEEVGLLFAQKISEKDLNFIVDINPKLPPTLYTDELRIKQVLINLLGNAVKFTESGFIKLSVDFKATSNNIHDKKDNLINLIFIVEDTGIGITEDFKKIMFDSFTQQDSKTTKQYEGTGLGLSISKKIVDLMNGKVHVESKKEKGSIIKVVFNEVKALLSKISDIDEIKFPLEGIKFKKSRLLLVDDNKSNLNYLTGALRFTNLEIVKAFNGAEALDQIKQKKPDLVITDLKMPKMDGYELLEKIKSNTKYNDIGIVVATASVMSEEREKIKSAGFDGFLVKPIQLNDLFIELVNHLPYEYNNNSIISKEDNKKVQESLDSVDKSELNELLVLLEQQVTPIWKNLRKQQAINEVKHFCEEITSLLVRYHNTELSNYKDKLKSSISSFDVAGILELLDHYPKLVNYLKNISN